MTTPTQPTEPTPPTPPTPTPSSPPRRGSALKTFAGPPATLGRGGRRSGRLTPEGLRAPRDVSAVGVTPAVPTVEPPPVLRLAVEAMDAVVDGAPADPTVLIETAGAAVQMRRCFTPGALYPPFPAPSFALSGPRGLATAMELLLQAAQQVPDPAHGLHLAGLWRGLREQLPSGWTPPTDQAPQQGSRGPDR